MHFFIKKKNIIEYFAKKKLLVSVALFFLLHPLQGSQLCNQGLNFLTKGLDFLTKGLNSITKIHNSKTKGLNFITQLYN